MIHTFWELVSDFYCSISVGFIGESTGEVILGALLEDSMKWRYLTSEEERFWGRCTRRIGGLICNGKYKLVRKLDRKYKVALRCTKSQCQTYAAVSVFAEQKSKLFQNVDV